MKAQIKCESPCDSQDLKIPISILSVPQVLSRLLPALRAKRSRPLIFSQWTAMLDVLEWVLELLGFTYVRLDGSTQVSERQALVDRFNQDEGLFAFLLSTRAGGQVRVS